MQTPSSRLIDTWILMITLFSISVLALAMSRSDAGAPTALAIAFAGAFLQPIMEPSKKTTGLQVLLFFSLLAASGAALAQDWLLAKTPMDQALIVGASLLAAITPFSHRPSIDLFSFVLMHMLYAETFARRTAVEPQEIALWVSLAIIRLALARACALEKELKKSNYRMLWLILSRAVKIGALLAVLALLGDPLANQTAKYKDSLQPVAEQALEQLRHSARWVHQKIETARQWITKTTPAEPEKETEEENLANLAKTMLAGQNPFPVDALSSEASANKGLKVLKPDQLRFERDLQEKLTPPGVPPDLILARAKTSPPSSRPPYLRRTIFEDYQDGAWLAASGEWRAWSPGSVQWVPHSMRVWVNANPAFGDQILIPSPFLGTEIEASFLYNGKGSLKLRNPAASIEFWAWTSSQTWNGWDLEMPVKNKRLLEVPQEIQTHPLFLRALDAVLDRVDQGENITEAVLAYCRENFRYTRQPGHQEGKDPVLEFLRTKRGFCQHYASLAAFLLRSQGVASRMAGGLAMGTLQDQEWIYGLEQGHAWVEVLSSSMGWTPLDPTLGTRTLQPMPPSSSGSQAQNGDSSPFPSDRASRNQPSQNSATSTGVPASREPQTNSASQESARLGQAADAQQDNQPPPSQNAQQHQPPHQETSPPQNTANGQADTPSTQPKASSGTTPGAPSETDPTSPASASDAPAASFPDWKSFSWDMLQIPDWLKKKDWLLMMAGGLVCVAGLALLRQRLQIEEVLGDRKGHEANPAQELEQLLSTLASGAPLKIKAQALFQMFSWQLAAWGYARAAHETEREYATVVARALGGAYPQEMETGIHLIEEARYGKHELSQNQFKELDHSIFWMMKALGRRLGLSMAKPIRKQGRQRGRSL